MYVFHLCMEMDDESFELYTMSQHYHVHKLYSVWFSFAACEWMDGCQAGQLLEVATVASCTMQMFMVSTVCLHVPLTNGLTAAPDREEMRSKYNNDKIQS